jgi:Fic family protein
MKPYDKTDLPIEFKYDLEMMTLLVKTRELFTKYNTILEYHQIDTSILLKPFLLQEAYKSLELSGSKINQSSLYYLKYEDFSLPKQELLNYFSILQNIDKYLTSQFKLSVNYLNNIHKDLFKAPKYQRKGLGKYRDEVTWIGQRGKLIYEADYIPTHPLDIPIAMGNYIKHFNKSFSADKLIDLAISHAQFENIHPYKDGNGRLGRILIPIQAFIETNNHISLYISEAIKNNEYSYYQALKDTRVNKWESYIKFFLKMIMEQLEINIKRIDQAIKVYQNDYIKISKFIPNKNAKKVYEYFFQNITATINEASSSLFIDYQTMRNYMNKLHNIGLLAKHKVQKGEFVYTYINMYNIHVPVEWM